MRPFRLTPVRRPDWIDVGLVAGAFLVTLLFCALLPTCDKALGDLYEDAMVGP